VRVVDFDNDAGNYEFVVALLLPNMPLLRKLLFFFSFFPSLFFISFFFFSSFEMLSRSFDSAFARVVCFLLTCALNVERRKARTDGRIRHQVLRAAFDDDDEFYEL
jgi:hypothetical protein